MTYTQWHAEQEERKASIHAKIQTALTNGELVGEEIHRNNTTLWPLCSPFLPEASTPEYLAEHLTNRHFGFGFDLIVSGTHYHVGMEV